MRIIALIIALGLAAMVRAQQDTARNAPADSIFNYLIQNRGQFTSAMVIDGDTVPWQILDEVLLVPTPSFDSDEARRRYYLLRRKVYRVYPYAVMAGTQFDTLNARLNRITKKRKRKQYIKEFQDYLEQRFEGELRNLTRSEGQILCKLIYRETDWTAYELLSEYRSGWTAFWYNVTANWYDISLKTGYAPETVDEDKLIEGILRKAFSTGDLVERERAPVKSPFRK